MAITRTAKGTFAWFDDEGLTDTGTLESVSISAGASIIVGVATGLGGRTVASVAWNGHALTQDATIANGSLARADIWSLHNCPGETGDVVVTWSDVGGGQVFAVEQVTGLRAVAFDQSHGATGNDDSPTSGATGSTTYGDEFLFCIVALNTTGSVGGTWQNSFTADQNNADLNEIAMSTGYRIVSSTGTYTGNKTGATSGQWATLLCTYKGQYVETMPLVEGGADAFPMGVAAGMQLAAGGMYGGSMGVVVGLPLVEGGTYMANTGVTFGAELVECGAWIGDPDPPPDAPFDPTTVVNLSATTTGLGNSIIRPTTPAELGDGSLLSFIDPYGHLIGPGSGEVWLYATAWPPFTGVGNIDHVKLYADVTVDDTVPAPNDYVPMGTREFFLKLSGGSRTTYGAVLNPAVLVPGGTAHWESGPITDKPGGGAWTWADLANIVEMGVHGAYTLGTNEYTNLQLAEFFAEVYGAIGTSGQTIKFKVRIGTLRFQVGAQQELGG